MPAVQVRVGLSRSTIYEAIGRDEFPPSISLGARAVGWLESDIDAWLETRVLASKTFSVAELKPARIQNARTQSTKLSKE
jgi:prophage regulatory protein